MESNESITPRLGLWDAVSIVVGIVVGTAIFRTSTMVFQNVSGPWQALGVWLLGGGLSLCGAFCYAELATTYPRDGGDYEYLSRAYGRWCGFLFALAQLTIILSASIGAMAYAFADYAAQLSPRMADFTAPLAAAVVVALSLTNSLGVVAGKITQNVLCVIKVLGLLAVAVAALSTDLTEFSSPITENSGASLGLAMVFVLYAFGGWNDAAFVAAEVRDLRRNLPRALIIGVVGITALYLAVNAAYLLVLGFEAARQTPTPASDVLNRAVGPWGRRAVSVLVMLSALGAINGMILTGSRIYATIGADYRRLDWLGAWNRRAVAPVMAIAVQGAMAVGLILLVGTATGRDAFDAMLHTVGLAGLPWEAFFGGFETLVAGSAPIFWMFFLLTGLAVFRLRLTDRDRPRPVAIPLYPLPPIVFCATCGYMLYSSLAYAGSLALIGIVPLVLGTGLYFILRQSPD